MSRIQLPIGYLFNFASARSHLNKNVCIRNTFCYVNNRVIQKVQLSTTSGNNSIDDESKQKAKLEEKQKSEEALEKLNKLLLSMTGENIASSKSKLDLAKPISKRRKGHQDEVKVESHETQIVNAAKNVAESIGGDIKQTQSELLMKLMNATNGDGVPTANLSDVVKGMKIDHERPAATAQTKAQQVRQFWEPSDLDSTQSKSRTVRPQHQLSIEKIDLFGSEPLGIFTEEQSNTTESVENKIWNQLYKKELKLAVTHPPSNYFQQMILWTEQGKVWKFPIDNEQGLEEEKKIYFTEHIFLEKHLEPWCPPKGPLRHFMELVCVGLSKNPYLTVEHKKEHIFWFRDYFEKKKQLLKETGVIDEQELGLGNAKDSQKQIE